MAPRRRVLFLLLLGAVAAASLLLAASAASDDAAPPGRSVSADLPGVVAPVPDVGKDGATAAVSPRPAHRLGPEEDRRPTSSVVIPAPAPSSSSKHATAGAPLPAACRDDDWDFGSFVLGFAVCAVLFVVRDEKAIRFVFVSDEEAIRAARGDGSGDDGPGGAEPAATAACAPAA
ncbi:hypothetical protein SEVIR_1G062220v4 [Setaria viridis]